MSKTTKIISVAVLVVILATIYVVGNQEIMAKITGAKTGNEPTITNAFLDKTKYLPGDQMLITAETKNASSVKAFIENEKGYNEIDLVMTIKNNGKETWMGQWKVSNSLNGKEYNLKITAYNKSGSAEKMLTWIDPNPGHDYTQISLPASGATWPNLNADMLDGKHADDFVTKNTYGNIFANKTPYFTGGGAGCWEDKGGLSLTTDGDFNSKSNNISTGGGCSTNKYIEWDAGQLYTAFNIKVKVKFDVWQSGDNQLGYIVYFQTSSDGTTWENLASTIPRGGENNPPPTTVTLNGTVSEIRYARLTYSTNGGGTYVNVQIHEIWTE